MVARFRLVTAVAATISIAFGAGLVLAQDVSGLLNQRRVDAITAQHARPAAPQAAVVSQQPATPAPVTAPMPDAQALANGLTSVTLQDPNAQPYLPAAGPNVLPPIRPSETELRARAERERLRAQRARQEAAARPVYVPQAPQQRTNRICNSAGRCPAENMIGIQY